MFSALLSVLEKSVGGGNVVAAPRGGRRASRRTRQQQDAQEFLSLLLDATHAVRRARGVSPCSSHCAACVR
jgi:hypothetical protein